jgi:hypothetical protein
VPQAERHLYPHNRSKLVDRSQIKLKRAALAVALLALLAAGGSGLPCRASALEPPTFESHWQDGRAELDGYRLSVTRYGQKRQGTAVMIFVTEPFSESKRVKVDDPAAHPADTFEALKLNLVRDFQTGIYDYNTMVSLFTRSRDFSPVKISFSSAEWCGHVYEEMLFTPKEIVERLASYFEDESRDGRLDLSVKGVRGIAEEELFVRLRDLRKEWIRPGAKIRVPFLASSFHRRLTHTPLRWNEAVIERSQRPERVTVPAGAFLTSVYTVRVPGVREGRFWIEQGYPHRVVRWEWRPAAQGSGGGARGAGARNAEGLDAGELTGSARLAYWRLHNLGDESYLRELGLTAGPGGAKAAPGGSNAEPVR